jgi:hypothetical protein
MVWLLLALLSTPTWCGPTRVVKVVEGTPRPRPTPVAAPEAVKPTPARDPGPLAGPDAWLPLAGKCVSRSQGPYVYELCPFQNFTQRERNAPNSWTAPFWGILGVFDRVSTIPSGSTGRKFREMLFSDGDRCGADPRTASVALECLEGEGDPEQCTLSYVEEPSTCVYSAIVHCRQLCGADLTVPPSWKDPGDGSTVEVLPSGAVVTASEQLRGALEALQGVEAPGALGLFKQAALDAIGSWMQARAAMADG